MVLLTMLGLLVAACGTGGGEAADDPVVATEQPAEATDDATEPDATEAPEPGASTGDTTFLEEAQGLTIIVPFAAGGPVDASARLFARDLQELVGTAVRVENKPGAGQQVAMTELVTSHTDGYTISTISFPSLPLTYLDAEKEAVYDRDDFIPVMGYVALASALAVQADSAYQSVQDVIDAANAGRVAVGTGGLLTAGHLPLVELEQAADVDFDFVHFDGGAEAATALLGGHVDAAFSAAPAFAGQVEAGELRLLALFDEQRSRFLPDVPTLEEEGYQADGALRYAFVLPAGVPDEAVEAWSAALRQVFDEPSFQQELEDANMEPLYMDVPALTELWDRVDTVYPELIDIVRSEN